MTKYFTVRVELHHKAIDNTEIYNHLHEMMESVKFTRIVKGASGKEYQLPDGVYSYTTSNNYTSRKIRHLAINAVVSTLKKFANINSPLPVEHYSILVSGEAPRMWVGLKEAKY